MDIAEFVAAEDDRLDLADWRAGDEWRRSVFARAFADSESQYRATCMRLYFAGCSRKEREVWRASILAVRTLVGSRRRGSSLKDARSWEQSHLDKIRVVAPSPAGFGEPIDSSRLHLRMTHQPSGAQRMKFGSIDLSRLNEKIHLNIMGIPEFFWQAVFYSLAYPSHPSTRVCACGRQLPAHTSSGRPSKLALCGACRYKKWSEREPKADLRARWRVAKRKQRKQADG